MYLCCYLLNLLEVFEGNDGSQCILVDGMSVAVHISDLEHRGSICLRLNEKLSCREIWDDQEKSLTKIISLTSLLEIFWLLCFLLCYMFSIHQNKCNCKNSGRRLVSPDLWGAREGHVLPCKTMALWGGGLVWSFLKHGLTQRHGCWRQRWAVFFPMVQRWPSGSGASSECRFRCARGTWGYVGKRARTSLNGNIKKKETKSTKQCDRKDLPFLVMFLYNQSSLKEGCI